MIVLLHQYCFVTLGNNHLPVLMVDAASVAQGPDLSVDNVLGRVWRVDQELLGFGVDVRGFEAVLKVLLVEEVIGLANGFVVGRQLCVR